jgi:hypothetical protein
MYHLMKHVNQGYRNAVSLFYRKQTANADNWISNSVQPLQTSRRGAVNYAAGTEQQYKGLPRIAITSVWAPSHNTVSIDCGPLREIGWLEPEVHTAAEEC